MTIEIRKMGFDIEEGTAEMTTLAEIKQNRYQSESDLKSSIITLKQSEDVIQRQWIEYDKCEHEIKELEKQITETTDTEERQGLVAGKCKVRAREDQILSLFCVSCLGYLLLKFFDLVFAFVVLHPLSLDHIFTLFEGDDARF